MTTENENIPKLLQNIAEAKDKQERESLERTNLDYGFYHGDCMEYLPDFPDNYFDLAIVDPPYGAGFTEGGDYNRFGQRFERYKPDALRVRSQKIKSELRESEEVGRGNTQKKSYRGTQPRNRNISSNCFVSHGIR